MTLIAIFTLPDVLVTLKNLNLLGALEIEIIIRLLLIRKTNYPIYIEKRIECFAFLCKGLELHPLVNFSAILGIGGRGGLQMKRTIGQVLGMKVIMKKYSLPQTLMKQMPLKIVHGFFQVSIGFSSTVFQTLNSSYLLETQTSGLHQ